MCAPHPLVLFAFLFTASVYAQTRFQLSGAVSDAQSNTKLAHVTVQVLDTGYGTITDSTGRFSLPLPKGIQTVQFSRQGYETVQRTILLKASVSLSVSMTERITLLRETTITANRPGDQVRSNDVGLTTLSTRTLRKLPTLLGELDVVRSIQFLPGVSSTGEASTGFNVRGGNADQNLMLLDEITLFNPSHLLGFMSVYNPDVVQDVSFFRGTASANYGGRAASVLQVRLKEAKASRVNVSGGVGLISSRLMIEAPVIRRKLSVYAAGRVSYADQLLQLIPINALTGIKAGFADLTARADYFPNAANKLSLTLFSSTDRFGLPGDSLQQVDLTSSRTLFNWQTQAVALNWSRYLSARWQMQTTAAWSRYQSTISSPDSARAYTLTSGVGYQQVKTGFAYTANARLRVETGVSVLRYAVTAGRLVPSGPQSQINPVALPNEQAIEAGAYLQTDLTLSKRLSMQAGLRYSWFGSLGPRVTYIYRPNAPRQPENRTDSVLTRAGTLAQTYGGIEPRFSVRFLTGDRSSVKLGLSRMIQYLQLLSNTTAALPADRWKTADPYLKPQIADQVSLGYFLTTPNEAIEVSVEAFYKRLTNVNDYKGNTTLLLNPYPETAVLQGNGYSRGLELFIRKQAGLLTGWISYTYSQTRFRVPGNYPDELINNGNYYPAPYDKPHLLNAILNYKLSPRVSVSLTGVYTSGRPITYPVAKLYIGNRIVPYYTDRNQGRLPDYVRCDVGLIISNPRMGQRRFESDWNFSLYNVLGRQNAYSIFVKTAVFYAQYYNRVDAYKLSIIGSVIPSISYNVRF